MASSNFSSPLADIEPRLRSLLPADLYATVWLDPSPASLTRVFEHLRTLQRVLSDYISRQVAESLPDPGEIRCEWQQGTLMFTDLAGFTPLLEAHADKGAEGAANLLHVLNAYFAGMIEIISKSGGNVLEFTGDAMLAQFPAGRRSQEAAPAVRGGLRMQRAMSNFAAIETDDGLLSLGMRIGIHSGRFLTADIGTPRRMDHVLLGNAVRATKQAEGAGKVGRVCLTPQFAERITAQFKIEPGNDDHNLVIDDLSDSELGEYEISAFKKRQTTIPLMDRSVEGLLGGITEMLARVEPTACYLPTPFLNLLVETAARRSIPPDFPYATIMFVNLIGISEIVEQLPENTEINLVSGFSRVFTLINAAVETRGGILKKVTYHLAGSDMMICFGVPQSHTDDPLRAVDAARTIRDLVAGITLPPIGDREIKPSCKIGLASGYVFAGEIGEPRGRREYNVLGDTVNTAARLMSKANPNQILLTEAVYQRVGNAFQCEELGALPLKGKSVPLSIYALR